MSDVTFWHFTIGYQGTLPVSDTAPCVLLTAKGVLVHADTDSALWLDGYRGAVSGVPACAVHLGTWDGQPVFAVEAGGLAVLDGVREFGLREANVWMDEEQACAVNMGRMLLRWQENQRFCQACGARLIDKTDERAHQCPSCQAVYYPPVTPAVITAVRRDGQLLLAHNVKFAGGMHGLIAGFVESGETLEHAVQREIMEEVGIQVQNIRYVASQSWPYPHNLMLGFTAEYAGGDVTPDGMEIDSAGWFTRERMPVTPRPGSIAWRLIEMWKGGEL